MARPSSFHEVSTIIYTDRSNMSIAIHQHIQIEYEMRYIHISPLALLDTDQILVLDSEVTHPSIMIPLTLYTDEQIKFVLEANERQCKHVPTSCLFYQISIDTMRIIYKDTWDHSNVLHPYRGHIDFIRLELCPLLKKRLVFVNIGCTSQEICWKLRQDLRRSRKSLGLYLDYSVNNNELQEIIINDNHLRSENIHMSKFVLLSDVEQLLQNLLNAANLHSNDTHVLSQIDLSSLKETLRDNLFGKTVILNDDNSEQQWNSVYWPNRTMLRPDRVWKSLKKKHYFYLSWNRIVMNETTSDTLMDEYVQEMYDQESFDLYTKYRHLFELCQRIYGHEMVIKRSMLKLKPILAYELNQIAASKFWIRQSVHMIKREQVYSVPIRLILPSPEESSVSNTVSGAMTETTEYIDETTLSPEYQPMVPEDKDNDPSFAFTPVKILTTSLENTYTTVVDQEATTSSTMTTLFDGTTDPTTMTTETTESSTETLLRGNAVLKTIPDNTRIALYCLGAKFRVLSAIYQSTSNASFCSEDVTNTVRQLCPNAWYCLVAADKTISNEIKCTYAEKQLHIVYTCDVDRYVFGPVLIDQDSSGYDIYINGKDYIDDVESIEACGMRCLETDRCVGVVYAPKGNRCWLKHTIVSRIQVGNRNSMSVYHPQRYPDEIIDNE
ncbi:unnamed protein product [Adineta ricciae]|uniref:Apple domain-containing protein n=1 Tax=Adineta ricciae TaxID=249248 RepID=A0A814QRU3_ADIRI|nr:unnamed protein product [Adineta ricciae]CAF1191881.1 unnamed protein product [Adineta ricciae]